MSNEKKKVENPFAFPLEYEQYLNEGMTIRDYFAAKVMQARISNFDKDFVQTEFEIAEYAYGIADAMLKERMK